MSLRLRVEKENDMEMINRCLEVSAAKRAEIEANDRHQRRKEEIAMRRELRGEGFGNRKERRRQAALERQSHD